MLSVVLACPAAGASPGERLAGLSLALRAVLTLQKHGAPAVTLVLDESDAELASRIREEPRVRVPVELRLRRTGEHPLRAALGDASEHVLVARHDVVVNPGVYRELEGAALGDAPGVVARCRGVGGAGTPVNGPMLLSPELGDALDGEGALEERVDELVGKGALKQLDTRAWGVSLAAPDGRRRAVDALFEDCRKPVDGIVSRHLNRHISIFISKRIVNTPLTPNMMSAVTLLLGVLAGVCVALGSYWMTLLGAFLWQWNSILDGVDGELARVRFQHSRFGQWFDTVSDDVTNVIFWSGLAVGAAPISRWLGWSGWIAAGSNLVVATLYYVELIAIGSGDVYDIAWDLDKNPPKGWFGKVALACRYILKKDFFILFCLAMAVLGVLHLLLPVMAAFGFGLLVAAVLRAMKRMLAPRAASEAKPG